MNYKYVVKYTSWFVVLLHLLACQAEKDPPVSFTTQLAGLNVNFPITIDQLLASKQASLMRRNTFPIHYFKRIDSTYVNWFYDWRKYPVAVGQTIPPDSAQLYGVVLLIPDKSTKIDSVKKWLESSLGKPMAQLINKHVNPDHESIYTLRPPVYSCVPSRGTRVSLRVGELQVGDYGLCGGFASNELDPTGNPRNLLRIAISYGLTPDEEERFAIGSGPTIWKDSD